MQSIIVRSQTFNTYDNAFLNQSGQFSFEYYSAKNNITKLDIVFINLGTNDVTYNDITSDPEFTKRIRILPTND